MANLLTEAGLPALFLLSFLASTLLPLGSEWLLITLIANHQPLWPAVLTATTGNYLGAGTTYFIGFWGATFLTEKVLGRNKAAHAKATLFYQRYGKWSLLLSWLPVVGDPLCLIGGVQRLNFGLFSLLVISGKLIRYAVVGVAANGGFS